LPPAASLPPATTTSLTTTTQTKRSGRYLHEEVEKDVVVSINEVIALTFLIVNEQLHCLRVLTNNVYLLTSSQLINQSIKSINQSLPQTSKNRLTTPPSAAAPPAILSSRDRSTAGYSYS